MPTLSSICCSTSHTQATSCMHTSDVDALYCQMVETSMQHPPYIPMTRRKVWFRGGEAGGAFSNSTRNLSAWTRPNGTVDPYIDPTIMRQVSCF